MVLVETSVRNTIMRRGAFIYDVISKISRENSTNVIQMIYDTTWEVT